MDLKGLFRRYWLQLSSTCFAFKTVLYKLHLLPSCSLCFLSCLRFINTWGQSSPLRMMVQVLPYQISPCFSPLSSRWGCPFNVCFARSQYAACTVNRGITYSGLPLVWLRIQWASGQTAARMPDLKGWNSVRNTKILRQRVSYYWLLCLSLIRSFTTDSGFQGLFGNFVKRAELGEGRE